MKRIELGPIITNNQLSRLRGILRQLDRSKSLLELATKDTANLLREIDKENESWTVLVQETDNGTQARRDNGR